MYGCVCDNFPHGLFNEFLNGKSVMLSSGGRTAFTELLVSRASFQPDVDIDFLVEKASALGLKEFAFKKLLREGIEPNPGWDCPIVNKLIEGYFDESKVLRCPICEDVLFQKGKRRMGRDKSLKILGVHDPSLLRCKMKPVRSTKSALSYWIKQRDGVVNRGEDEVADLLGPELLTPQQLPTVEASPVVPSAPEEAVVAPAVEAVSTEVPLAPGEAVVINPSYDSDWSEILRYASIILEPRGDAAVTSEDSTSELASQQEAEAEKDLAIANCETIESWPDHDPYFCSVGEFCAFVPDPKSVNSPNPGPADPDLPDISIDFPPEPVEQVAQEEGDVLEGYWPSDVVLTDIGRALLIDTLSHVGRLRDKNPNHWVVSACEVSNMKIPYNREARIVDARGVREVKSDLRVGQISCEFTESGSSMIAPIAAAIATLVVWWMVVFSSVVFDVVMIGSPFFFSLSILSAALFCPIFMGAVTLAYYRYSRAGHLNQTIIFVPHAAASIINSFDTTDPNAVVSNIGYRWNQLAALPVPAEIAVELKSGTITVAKSAILKGMLGFQHRLTQSAWTRLPVMKKSLQQGLESGKCRSSTSLLSS
jgi:hypothetical protein